MKRKNSRTRLLALLLAFAMVATSLAGNNLTSVYAADETSASTEQEPTLVALCDASGYTQVSTSDYSTDTFYVSLNTKIAYALSGYSLASYYSWYPSYFQDTDGNDVYAALQTLCGDKDYCSLSEEALGYVKTIAYNFWGSESYWYEFVCVDQSLLAGDDTEAEDTEVAEETEASEVSYVQLYDSTSMKAVYADYVQSDLYVNVDAPLDYAFYGKSMSDYHSGKNGASYFTLGDVDYYEELVDYIGEDAGYVQVDDTIEQILRNLATALYQSASYAYYYYTLCYIPSSLLKADDEEVAYTNLCDASGNAKVSNYTQDDLYFSLTAGLDYTCYSYSLSNYYGWYGPSTGYTYFVDADGNDIYAELEELVGDQEYAPVTDEMIPLLEDLASAWYGSSSYADYYYLFLQIPESLVAADDDTDSSYDWNYVAEQYVNLASGTDGSAIVDYSEEDLDGLYVSLTDDLTWSCCGYSLSDYYGWYGPSKGYSYFTDENGTDVYAALEELMGDERFIPVDETVLGYLKTIAANWNANDSEGYRFWYQFVFVDTGYQEVYDESGYTKVSLYMEEELFVNLNQPLQYILYDIDGDYVDQATEPLSLSDAYYDKNDSWDALFVDPDSDTDLYTQLYNAIGDSADVYGFAPITDEMIPILKKLAYNRWSMYGDYTEYWDCYCFYKACDISGRENPYEDDENVGEVRLVYGDEDLADEDAYILTLFGDGFTAEEQEDFYQSAEDLAQYMMTTEPFTDLTAAIKIYAIATVSEESGTSNEDVSNYANVGKAEYVKDTYFDATYWGNGTQRLVVLPKEGEMKLSSLTRFLVPDSDISGVIVNSLVYGGSGGSYLTTSLEASAPEIFIHEFGHTCADLSDEYYAGPTFELENTNMTATSDPTEVKWADFIGVDGCGVYPYTDYSGNETGWYRPSQNCKMQYLGTKYPFCPVCREQIRKSVCQASNVGILFYQPYANTFNSGDVDLAPYFILRQGKNETTLDQVDASLVSYSYTDADGNEYEGMPENGGVYTVTASFAGDDTYDACTVSAEVTVNAKVVYTDGVEDEEIFADSVTYVAPGEAMPTMEDPERTGYTFAGWDQEVAETVTGDVTYTALWTANTYTVTFLGNGAKDPAAKTFTFDKKLGRLPRIGRVAGMNFEGWYVLNEDGTIGEEVTASTVMKTAGDITLIALRSVQTPYVYIYRQERIERYGFGRHASAKTVTELTASVWEERGLTYSYQWYLDGEEIEGATERMLEIDPNEAGTYTVSVTIDVDENSEIVTTGAVSAEAEYTVYERRGWMPITQMTGFLHEFVFRFN